MIAVALAVAGALAYGFSDFLCGVLSRRGALWPTALTACTGAFLGTLVLALTVSGTPEGGDFAWAAGPFAVVSGTSPRGVRVNVYRVGDISAASAQSMLSVAESAIDFHAQRYGAYPYGEVDVVLDNRYWFGGMEYPGFVLDLVSSVALAHELAHQWWYGIVGDDEYNSPWLDESFADYAALMKSQPRYQAVVAAGHDARAFAEGLQRAGYATDPRYADKLAGAIATTQRLRGSAV